MYAYPDPGSGITYWVFLNSSFIMIWFSSIGKDTSMTKIICNNVMGPDWLFSLVFYVLLLDFWCLNLELWEFCSQFFFFFCWLVTIISRGAQVKFWSIWIFIPIKLIDFIKLVLIWLKITIDPRTLVKVTIWPLNLKVTI